MALAASHRRVVTYQTGKAETFVVVWETKKNQTGKTEAFVVVWEKKTGVVYTSFAV